MHQQIGISKFTTPGPWFLWASYHFLLDRTNTSVGEIAVVFIYIYIYIYIYIFHQVENMKG